MYLLYFTVIWPRYILIISLLPLMIYFCKDLRKMQSRKFDQTCWQSLHHNTITILILLNIYPDPRKPSCQKKFRPAEETETKMKSTPEIYSAKIVPSMGIRKNRKSDETLTKTWKPWPKITLTQKPEPLIRDLHPQWWLYGSLHRQMEPLCNQRCTQ